MRKYSLFAYFLYWVCSKGFSRSLGRPFKSRPFVKKHHNPMGCGVFSLSKNFQYAPVSGIIKETGVLLWNNGEKTQEAKQLLWI